MAIVLMLVSVMPVYFAAAHRRGRGGHNPADGCATPPMHDSNGRATAAPSTASVASGCARKESSHAGSNGPGDRYAVHRHGYTKLLMCAAGSIAFLIGTNATPVELEPGDGFVLPAGIPHAAAVGPGG